MKWITGTSVWLGVFARPLIRQRVRAPNGKTMERSDQPFSCVPEGRAKRLAPGALQHGATNDRSAAAAVARKGGEPLGSLGKAR